MKAGAKILIVEDERIVALDIRNQLKQMGFPAPLMASSGEEAIKIAEEDHPDIILMDITLSDGQTDGITAASRINALVDVPIIYVTAQADEETIQRVKSTKMYGYILKPIYYRELEIAIEFALHKHEATRKLNEQRKWLVTTIRGIGDGIITTDENGRVVLMNPAAENITGWTESEARGRDLSDVYQTFDREIPESGAAFVWAGGKPSFKTKQTMMIGRSGREIPIHATIWDLNTDEATPMGRIIVLQDMSQAERLKWNMPPRAL